MIVKLLNDKDNFPRISIESTSGSTDHRLGQASSTYLTRETLKISVWCVRDQLCTIKTTTAESHTFATGTDVYDVTNAPLSAISLVTGTESGTPDHTFVNGTDYERNDGDGDGFWESINWLGVELPDDATDFYVSYNRKAGGLELARIVAQDIWSYIRQNWRLNWSEKVCQNPKLISSVPVTFDEDLGLYRYELSVQFSMFNSTETV